MNFDFFAKLDIYGQLLFVFLCLSAFFTAVMFLRWLWVEVKTFLKDRSISIGSVNVKPKTEVSSHIGCPNVKDFIDILQFQQLTLVEIYRIQDKEILRDQMAYAENKTDICSNLAEKVFCQLMGDNNISNYLLSAEYASYKALLFLIKEKTLTKFRHMCKENHFTDRTDDEFDQYIQDHVLIISDMIMFLAKNFYPLNSEIKHFDERINKIYPDVKKHIADVIEHAREVSKTKQKEIERLWDNFSSEYKNITGNVPARVVL